MNDFWNAQIKPLVQARLFSLPPLEESLALLDTARKAIERAKHLDELVGLDPSECISDLRLIGQIIDQTIDCLRHMQEEQQR